jgi:hypothetical protein
MNMSMSHQCSMLGYDLHYWCKDVYGKKHRYCTSSFLQIIVGGGAILYFDSRKFYQRMLQRR